MSNKPR